MPILVFGHKTKSKGYCFCITQTLRTSYRILKVDANKRQGEDVRKNNGKKLQSSKMIFLLELYNYDDHELSSAFMCYLIH